MTIRSFPMLIKASLFEPWLKTFFKTGPLKFSINFILLQCKRGEFCMHGIFPMALVCKMTFYQQESWDWEKSINTNCVNQFYTQALATLSHYIFTVSNLVKFRKKNLFVPLRHCLLKNTSKSCITFISIFVCFPLFVCLIYIISSQFSNEPK